MTKILIADPDPRVQGELSQMLAPRGYEVITALDAESALRRAGDADVDLLLAELQLPGQGGFGLLDVLHGERPDLGIILMAAFGSVEDAVHAMRGGAADFLSKPFAPEQVLLAVDRALEKATLLRENHDLRQALDDRVRLPNLVGDDPGMQAIFKTVQAVADTRTTVLITGESGTGKTLLARAIHSLSPRRKGPFVEVHCGAMPETLLESELFGHVRGAFTGSTRDRPGKFETASGGTIFLDEIGTSSPALQVKLLRVVQERVIERVGDNEPHPVDVRIVLATNLDLEKAVRDGRFREDLYYRINVVSVEMPPLRARPGDIPSLADHFRQRFNSEHGKRTTGFTPAATAALQRGQWPGNVRQLENVIERAVVLCQGERIDLGDLPPTLSAAAAPAEAAMALAASGPVLPLKQALAGPEKLFLERALQQCGGNREQAARVLGINRSTLFAKLRKHGIK